MRIVAVIPSRYSSSRFPGKPLALIKGKPMIQHVYQRVASASLVDRVVVATDDERITTAVESFGGQAIMTSSENRSGTDRVAETATYLNIDALDIVINIQGDQPLIDPRALDQVVDPLKHNPDLGMTTLAFRIKEDGEYTNPKDVKVTMDRNGFALYFSRASIPFARDGRKRPPAYKHLGVYAYTRKFLGMFTKLPQGQLEQVEKLEQLRAMEHGFRIKVVVTPYDSPEVDLPSDIKVIERKITG